MASPKEFSLFAKLPAELRIIIWEMSILEYHRDRLVPLQDITIIMCIRKLACSPHFYVTWESRKVATDLYPIRLPIINTDSRDCQHKGAIYISTEHDIFILDIDILTSPLNDEMGYIQHSLGGSVNFEWPSSILSPLQRQSVKRIMLFDMISLDRLKAGCHRDCVIWCGAMDFYNTWFNIMPFSGIQKLFYAVLSENFDGRAMYLNILRMSGHSVLDSLKKGNMLACFDGKDVKKHREEGMPSKCVCTTRHD
ncbi:hypothetical protein F4860DRAFT_519363 [Xylaria cubensis]|nr:hypothetical protein F4860DRAFT_519363 [Xylaria cubensis]